MQNISYSLGINLSPNGNFRIEVSSIVERNGQTFYAAQILKKVRSYWEPVKAGLYLLKSELDEYYE